MVLPEMKGLRHFWTLIHALAPVKFSKDSLRYLRRRKMPNKIDKLIFSYLNLFCFLLCPSYEIKSKKRSKDKDANERNKLKYKHKSEMKVCKD